MSHLRLPNVINAPGHDSVSGHVLLHENRDSFSEATWYVNNIYIIQKKQESHCSNQQERWGLHPTTTTTRTTTQQPRRPSQPQQKQKSAEKSY